MIAFGSSMSDPEAFRRYARPGIELAAERDSEIFAYAASGPVCRSYNLVLDRASACADLEALVVVQQDVEIADPDFCRKVRQALSDPEVGVVGSVGSSGARSIAWWEGSVSCAPIVHRYHEHGEGEIPGFAWTHPGPAPAEVDTLAGFLLVLSPWVVRNVRFDEELVLGHGYDFDFCQQVRAAGRKVVTADLTTIHHHPLKLIKDRELDLWIEAHIRVAEKWDGRLPGAAEEPVDWRRRARRAEAEREAAKTMAYSGAHEFDARVLPLEREFEDLTSSFSWRLTEPLRRLNSARRSATKRMRGRGA